MYFKADERPEQDKPSKHQHNPLFKLKVTMHTLSGRLLKYEEILGRFVVLDYNKSILSKVFNPSKFDFNWWDREKNRASIFFRLNNSNSFKVNEEHRLGCAAMLPTVGVPNWPQKYHEEEEFVGNDAERQVWC